MTSRIAGFDGLRAVAVILVFMEHKVIEGYPCGSLGVKLFFVLSGYLIVSILHKQRASIEGGSSVWAELGEFWRRRALRIFPIYFLTLAVLSLVIWEGGIQSQGIGYYWLMAGNLYLHAQGVLTGKFHWGDFGHLWSVAVENQFYAIAGFALLFLPRRVHVQFLACVLLASLASILVVLLAAPDKSFHHVMPLPNFAFMAAGGLIPLWWERRKRPPTLPVALLAGVTLLALNRLQHRIGLAPVPYSCIESLLELVLSFGVIAHVAIHQRGLAARSLEWHFLQRLGAISYGFYVYHMFGPYLIDVTNVLGLREPSHVRNLVWMPVQFALTVIVAELSWRLIEQPMMRLKSGRPVAPESQYSASSRAG